MQCFTSRLARHVQLVEVNECRRVERVCQGSSPVWSNLEIQSCTACFGATTVIAHPTYPLIEYYFVCYLFYTCVALTLFSVKSVAEKNQRLLSDIFRSSRVSHPPSSQHEQPRRQTVHVRAAISSSFGA